MAPVQPDDTKNVQGDYMFLGRRGEDSDVVTVLTVTTLKDGDILTVFARQKGAAGTSLER